MKELTTITIMRKWDNPQILITVNNELIELKMTMTDFQRIVEEELKRSLKKELPALIGSVTWTFRQETFIKRVESAVEESLPAILSTAITDVLSSIKSESNKIV